MLSGKADLKKISASFGKTRHRLNRAAEEERLFRSFGDPYDGIQNTSAEVGLDLLDERQVDTGLRSHIATDFEVSLTRRAEAY